MVNDNSLAEDETRPSLLKRVGGQLCLDFTNTIDPRHGEHPHEYLKNYADLVVWSRYVDILTENEAQHLLYNAAKHPAIAAIVFQRALTLRETLYQTFSSIIKGKQPTEEQLEILNVTLAEGMARARIFPKGDGFLWTWSETSHALERILWPIARSAAELLISDDVKYIKECPGDDGCGWLFVDTSRNHRRRWCDMEGCGNRAKARRYYERTGKRSSATEER
ncbi:MAG TPA: ABATE domain-containing protein [Ktedonobacteraceae bacterium]